MIEIKMPSLVRGVEMKMDLLANKEEVKYQLDNKVEMS